MKKIFNKINLIKLITIMTGLFWFSIFVYFRLFVSRTSYTLESLKYTIDFKHYVIFTLFIIIHIILLISIVLYKNFIVNKKTAIKPFFKYIIEKLQVFINNIFWIPLDKIHDIITPKIPGSSRFFLFIEHKCTTNHITPTFFSLLILIFNIIPKLITAFIFVIDIVILGSYKYFIYALPFLLIPIMFNIFLKTFKSFADRNLITLKEYFTEIKYVGDTFDSEGTLISSDRGGYEFHVKPEYSHAEEEMAEVVKVLFQLGYIVEYTTAIKNDI